MTRLLATLAVLSTTLGEPACRMPAPSPASGPTADRATQAELVKAREAVWRAYFGGDEASLVRLLPEHMVGMGRDRAAIIVDAQAFAREGGRLVSITFTNDEFFVSADVAVVYSHYDARLDTRGTASGMVGRAIELFIRRDGRWQNPSWHLDPER